MLPSIPAPGIVPVIETERLRLRPHHPGDFADVVALWTDPTVTRFIGGRPSAPDEVWSRILRYAGLWCLLGFGYWAVEEKGTGAFAGELGFADFKRPIEPPLDGMPEFGWALASPMHGKGYATEAARAALSWADRHFGRARTVCIIHPDNMPSLRIAQKTGYRELERTTYKGQPTIVFARQPAAETT